MTQAAKAQESSMEEILASIRRIIADDDASKPAKPPESAAPPKSSSAVAPPPSRPAPMPSKAATPPAPKPATPSVPASNSQEDIDAMLAELDGSKAAPKSAGAEVLDLTKSMTAPAPAFRTIDGSSDVVYSNK